MRDDPGRHSARQVPQHQIDCHSPERSVFVYRREVLARDHGITIHDLMMSQQKNGSGERSVWNQVSYDRTGLRLQTHHHRVSTENDGKVKRLKNWIALIDHIVRRTRHAPRDCRANPLSKAKPQALPESVWYILRHGSGDLPNQTLIRVKKDARETHQERNYIGHHDKPPKYGKPKP